MNINEYIDKLKTFHNDLLEYIEKDDDIEEHYQKLIQFFDSENIRENNQEIAIVLHLLIAISKNHYRGANFFSKIEKIILIFKESMKKKFTNLELFNFFRKSKSLLLFAIKEKIVIIDRDIITKIKNGEFFQFIRFFNPEIKANFNDNKISDDFEEKRKNGENENYICELIRKDLIEDFIIYVNKNSYPLNSPVKQSIFETNSLLTKIPIFLNQIENRRLSDDSVSLIQYAAFFGSVQIFKYLYKNDVKVDSSIWIFAIHSDNPEMIHFLEESELEHFDDFYKICLIESIKCHHRDITNYIQNNFVEINDFDQTVEKKCFHYYNFAFFPKEFKFDYLFSNACEYDYYTIVDILLKTGSSTLIDETILTLNNLTLF